MDSDGDQMWVRAASTLLLGCMLHPGSSALQHLGHTSYTPTQRQKKENRVAHKKKKAIHLARDATSTSGYLSKATSEENRSSLQACRTLVCFTHTGGHARTFAGRGRAGTWLAAATDRDRQVGLCAAEPPEGSRFAREARKGPQQFGERSSSAPDPPPREDLTQTSNGSKYGLSQGSLGMAHQDERDMRARREHLVGWCVLMRGRGPTKKWTSLPCACEDHLSLVRTSY